MSLFSKIFGGDKEAEKAAKDLLNGLFGQPNQTSGKPESAPQSRPEEPQTQNQTEVPSGPSGFSWGPVMPDEPNQYNYNGPFWAYFEEIFHQEFSRYRIEKAEPQPKRRFVYTFYDGTRKALVVELVGSSSEPKAVRAKCARENVPYLRYYYDYEGWWNTRKYVVSRTGNALN